MSILFSAVTAMMIASAQLFAANTSIRLECVGKSTWLGPTLPADMSPSPGEEMHLIAVVSAKSVRLDGSDLGRRTFSLCQQTRDAKVFSDECESSGSTQQIKPVNGMGPRQRHLVTIANNLQSIVSEEPANTSQAGGIAGNGRWIDTYVCKASPK